MRRKFDEALKALTREERSETLANIGLEYCNKLFALEHRYDELNLKNEERARMRETESKTVAEAFFAWA